MLVSQVYGAIHRSQSRIICQCQRGGDSGHSSLSTPLAWAEATHRPDGRSGPEGAAHTGDTNPPLMGWGLQQTTDMSTWSVAALRHGTHLL